MNKRENENLLADFEFDNSGANPEIVKTSIKNNKTINQQNINANSLFNNKKEKDNIAYKGIYFKQENWDYIQKVAKKSGMNNSQIVNKIISFFKEQEK